MATVYGDYTRDRNGLFFGLSGGQLITLVVAGVPALWAFQRQQWRPLAGLVLAWLVVLALVAVPIRGRSATGWLVASDRPPGRDGAALVPVAVQGRERPQRRPGRAGPARRAAPGSASTTARRRARRTPGSRSSRTTPTGCGRSPPRSPTPAWRWPTAPSATARPAA